MQYKIVLLDSNANILYASPYHKNISMTITIKRLLPVALLLYGVFSGTRFIAQAKEKTEYERKYEQICSTVTSEFYDPALGGVDWKKISESYRAKVTNVHNKSEFETLMNVMLDQLHASHAAYVSADDAEYNMMLAVRSGDMQKNEIDHIGVMGIRDESGYTVSATLDGGPAERAGILSGDRLVRAEGRPFTSAGSFRGKSGGSVSIDLIRGPDKKALTLTVKPEHSNVLGAFLEATKRSAHIIKINGKRIGYIHLWTMANDRFKSVLEQELLNRLHDTDGLMLDLRDGYGGNPFGYADTFFRPDISFEERGRRMNSVRHSGYSKPIALLTNAGTRSAKEYFSYQMKSSHRAVLVGTQTAGAFLGASFFDIGSDGLLELPIVGLKLDGHILEKNGVVPDIVVAPFNSYRSDDAQITAAEKILLTSIENSKPFPKGLSAY